MRKVTVTAEGRAPRLPDASAPLTGRYASRIQGAGSFSRIDRKVRSLQAPVRFRFAPNHLCLARSLKAVLRRAASFAGVLKKTGRELPTIQSAN